MDRMTPFLVIFLLLIAGSTWADPVPEDPLQTLTRLFAPHLMETKSSSPPGPMYCGVEITALVRSAWWRMSPELRRHIPDLYRPEEFMGPITKSSQGSEVCDLFLDTAHFRVHYSTDPEHQPPGYPDLQMVHDLASSLETAYAYHRDVSGMGVVLPDGDFGGGMDLIDCYYYNLDDIFGHARGAGRVETDCDSNHWGYLAVNTDFGSYDAASQLRLTSEHEYFHLLQYSHSSNENSWFMESTARNSEFHVWPEIALPRGVYAWMAHPFYSLYDDSGFHQYAPHFWMYLEAHHGRDFVSRIWERCCHTVVDTALAAELADLGSSLDDVLPGFAVWNYFTGERDDGDHYDPDFRLYAVHHQAHHDEYPVQPTSIPSGLIARQAGSNYIRFDGPASDNDLHLSVDGDTAMVGQRAVMVLGVNEWSHKSWILEPDADGDVELIVPDWGLFDYVTLVVSNFWDSPSDSLSRHYSYAASEVEKAGPVTDPARLMMSAPNPFGNSTRVLYYSASEGSSSTIRVYDTAGRLVRTLIDEPVYSGLHQVIWDGRDQQGRRAATGMYILRLENGPHQHTSKVMFVR